MNGLLLIFLLSFVAQGPGELLPGPSRGAGAANPSAVMPSGPQIPNLALQSKTGYTFGYGYDADGQYCMIIQIAPEAIAVFAQGERGQELPVQIPPEIRDHVQRVIIRVGTGDVERILPKNPSFSSTRNNNAPFVASLGTNNNPTPVTIDPPRNAEVMPTSGANNGYGNNASSGSAFGLNAPPLGNNNLTNAPPIAPNLNAPNPGALNWDRTNQGTWPGVGNSNYPTSDPTGRYVNSNAQNTNPNYGNNGIGSDVLPNSNAVGLNDRFTPSGSARTPSAFDILRSNNNMNTPPANSTGYNNYANTANNGAYGRSGPGAVLAQNTNVPSGYGDSLAPNFPSTNPNYGTNYNHNNYQGSTGFPTSYPPNATPNNIPTMPSVNGYASNSMLPNSTLPQFRTANNPNLSTNTSGSNFPSASGYPQVEHSQQAVTTNRFLQYFSLFSVVANVYLMIWMVHLRTRYRELVSNMRGIPLSELS